MYFLTVMENVIMLQMNVGLAKDVLSWSVSKSLTLLPNAQGTAKYVELFARYSLIASNLICTVNFKMLGSLQYYSYNFTQVLNSTPPH